MDKSIFERIKRTDENGNKFWMARTLAKELDYTACYLIVKHVDPGKEALALGQTDFSAQTQNANTTHLFKLLQGS